MWSTFWFFDSLFPIFFTIIFVIVIGTFIVVAVRGISEWGKNNNSPRLKVQAKVVAKRSRTSHHNTGPNGAMHMTTTYYATFQVESGDRMELHVSPREYGMLAEGDIGSLEFQGTRYLSFTRS